MPDLELSGPTERRSWEALYNLEAEHNIVAIDELQQRIDSVIVFDQKGLPNVARPGGIIYYENILGTLSTQWGQLSQAEQVVAAVAPEVQLQEEGYREEALVRALIILIADNLLFGVSEGAIDFIKGSQEILTTFSVVKTKIYRSQDLTLAQANYIDRYIPALRRNTAQVLDGYDYWKLAMAKALDAVTTDTPKTIRNIVEGQPARGSRDRGNDQAKTGNVKGQSYPSELPRKTPSRYDRIKLAAPYLATFLEQFNLGLPPPETLQQALERADPAQSSYYSLGYESAPGARQLVAVSAYFKSLKVDLAGAMQDSPMYKAAESITSDPELTFAEMMRIYNIIDRVPDDQRTNTIDFKRLPVIFSRIRGTIQAGLEKEETSESAWVALVGDKVQQALEEIALRQTESPQT